MPHERLAVQRWRLVLCRCLPAHRRCGKACPISLHPISIQLHHTPALPNAVLAYPTNMPPFVPAALYGSRCLLAAGAGVVRTISSSSASRLLFRLPCVLPHYFLLPSSCCTVVVAIPDVKSKLQSEQQEKAKESKRREQ